MKLNTYNHKDYSGGLNDTDNAKDIDRNEASTLHDWLLREKGKLIQRPGLTQVGSTLSNAAAGLHAFIQTDGTKDLLVMDGTSLKYNNSGTFAALDSGFTAGKDFAFVTTNLNDRVYLCNEENTLHYWDRASTTLNSCLTDSATAPHGNVMVWFKNYLFHLNNVTISGTAYPERLYWSALSDPDTYDTANDYASLPNGGRLITAIPFGESSLVIFQEHAIKFLQGYGDTDWQINATSNNFDNLDESVGCVAPKGVVGVGNEVWFMDDEGNVRRITQTDFNAFRTDIISTNLQTTLSGINKNKLSLTTAHAFDNYVMFSVPNGSDTTNSLVLVYDIIAARRNSMAGNKMESWTTFTGWHANFFIDYPTSSIPDLYISDSSAKKIYKWYGDDDAGTAIDCVWTGKDDDFNYPERYKRARFGYFRGTGTSGDVSVGMYGSTDGNDMLFLKNLELQTTGSTLGPTGTDTLGPTGTFLLGGPTDGEVKFYYARTGGSATFKTLQHSIRHAVAGESAEAKGFTSHYKLRSLR